MVTNDLASREIDLSSSNQGEPTNISTPQPTTMRSREIELPQTQSKQPKEEPIWKTAARYVREIGAPFALSAMPKVVQAMELLPLVQGPQEPLSTEEETHFGELQKLYPERNFAEEYKQAQPAASKYSPSFLGMTNLAEDTLLGERQKSPEQYAAQVASQTAAITFPGEPRTLRAMRTGLANAVYAGLVGSGHDQANAAQIAILLGTVGFGHFQQAIEEQGQEGSLGQRNINYGGSKDVKASEIAQQAMKPQESLFNQIGTKESPKITSAEGRELSVKPYSPEIGLEQRPTKSQYEIMKGVPEMIEGAIRKETPSTPAAPKQYPKPSAKRTQAHPITEAGAPTEGPIPRAQGIINQLGTEYVPRELTVEPVERLGSSITNFEARDPVVAGQRMKPIVNEQSEEAYHRVNQAYDHSRQLNEGIYEPEPELFTDLDRELDVAGHLPDFKKDEDVMNKMREIRNALVMPNREAVAEFGPRMRGEEGEPQFRQISSQELIDLSTNLRQYVQQKYPHDPSNIYYQIINRIEDRIAARAQDNPQAYQAYANARQQYRDWATTYNNDFIRKFTNAQNTNFKDLFDSSLNVDNYNKLSPILQEGGTPGNHYNLALRRKIVQDSIEDVVQNKSGNINTNALDSGALDKRLDTLGINLTPHERQGITRQFQQITRSKPKIMPQVVKKYKAPVTAKTSKIISSKERGVLDWLNGKDPEQIAKIGSTPGGVHKLDKVFELVPDGAKKWKEQKIDLFVHKLRGGKRTPTSETDSIATFLDNVENHDYAVATIGAENVAKLEQVVKRAKTYEISLEKLNKKSEQLDTAIKKASGEQKERFEHEKKGLTAQKIKLMAQREATDWVLSRGHIPYHFKKMIIDKSFPLEKENTK